MPEFERSVKKIEEQLQVSKGDFQKGWSSFHRAEKSYEKLYQERENALRNILEQKSLVVCPEGHFDWKDKNSPSLEQLGVFPKNKMRLRYDQGMTANRDRYTSVVDEYGVAWVRLLCPEHYTWGIAALYGTKEVPKITSEVIKKEGKFILTENGWDITKLVKGGRKSTGFFRIEEINLDGHPYPNQAIYKYFGIPDLPEKPDVDKVKYGR